MILGAKFATVPLWYAIKYQHRKRRLIFAENHSNFRWDKVFSLSSLIQSFLNIFWGKLSQFSKPFSFKQLLDYTINLRDLSHKTFFYFANEKIVRFLDPKINHTRYRRVRTRSNPIFYLRFFYWNLLKFKYACWKWWSISIFKCTNHAKKSLKKAYV